LHGYFAAPTYKNINGFASVAREFKKIRHFGITSRADSRWMLQSLSDASLFPSLRKVSVSVMDDISGFEPEQLVIANRQDLELACASIPGRFFLRWCNLCGKCQDFGLGYPECVCRRT
jgi:hypothetical protein